MDIGDEDSLYVFQLVWTCSCVSLVCFRALDFLKASWPKMAYGCPYGHELENLKHPAYQMDVDGPSEEAEARRYLHRGYSPPCRN